MNVQTHWHRKNIGSVWGACIFWITLVATMICFVSPSMAGTPVGNEVFFYDVESDKFGVVWQVDANSTCTVNVYTGQDGSGYLTPGTDIEVDSITNGSADFQKRGIMEVKVSGLSFGTTYYVQTVSTDSLGTHEYPAPGSLLSVRTRTEFTGAGNPNGGVAFSVFNPGGIDPGNLITDIIVLVDVPGATSPLKLNYNSGFGAYYRTLADLTRWNASNNSEFWDWSADTDDHPFTIRILGGLTPDNGYGQKTINRTYLNADEGSGKAPCFFIQGQDDIASCEALGNEFKNQVILLPNQPPDFDLDAEYPADLNQLLEITVCAYDPEGDDVTSITLSNDPNGMTIGAHPTDANCRVISWTPTECGEYDNIQVTASDASGSQTKTFKVNVLSCPPSQPTVSIAPSAPVTSDDITCTVTPSSVTDPDGDAIELLFEWYEVDGVGHIAAADATTVFDENNASTYTNDLDFSFTSKGKGYYCQVTASDTDGDAPVAVTNTVTVGNTPPSPPASAAITPAGDAENPKTDQALTCTITEASPPDADTGDSVTYKYEWSTTGGGDTYDSGGYISDLTHELPASKTDKEEVWSCTVTAYDETDESVTSTTSSNSVEIKNTPPEIPDGATVTPASPDTTQDLTCTVDPDATVDADAGDVASIRYEYVWSCTDCGGKSDITHGPQTGTTDTLSNADTVKGETWSCDVRAVDSSDAPSAGAATSNAVTVINTAPTGLAVQVEPDPNAYDDQDLTCTVTTVPTDPDEGDTLQYKYEWNEQGGALITHDFSANTTDTLGAAETSQGETWTCTVTAKDSSDAQDATTSNEVLIYNRFPTITTNTQPSSNPSGLEQAWDIGVAYTIEVTADDPDGNEFTLEVDPNYTDPNDAEVKDWLTFERDTNQMTISGTPPESAAETVLTFKFVVEETNGNPIRMVEKSMIVTILTPKTIVDDFEYSSLKDNGWYKLQGNGKMLLKSETLPDETINQYLRTELNTTPSKNSQLNLIFVKEIPNNVFTLPCVSFFIKDSNMYYIDFYVRAEKDGKEKKFFIRYTPDDPNETYSWKDPSPYVTWRIGSEYIDPNGVEVSRSLYDDLFIPTGYRLLYLQGIVVRGDVDYLDDIAVKSCGPPPPLPKDVQNLAAQGNENQITLTWDLDPAQEETIAGYRIYMDETATPAKVSEKLIATVDPNTTSLTVTGLDNGTTYYFLVTAFDETRDQQETDGVEVTGIPQATIPLDPADLKAESINGSIKLSWKNPHAQHADLAGYIIFFKNCAGVDCGTIREEAVAATSADANVPFVYFVTKDANNQALVAGQQYNFTVKAVDGASPPNLSSGVAVSITLSVSTSLVVDNFDLNYSPNDTPQKKGWFKLQGRGSFGLKLEDGDNHLDVASTQTGSAGLTYIITKMLKNPEKFDKPKFSISIRSAGHFRIDIYLKGMDNKNYFLGLIGDPTTDQDSSSFTKEATRWYKTTLGWQNKADGKFHEINLDLHETLQDVAGVEFKHLLGILSRGKCEVDDIEVNIGTPDPQNLTARPIDGEVLLSWTVPETADPNTIDKTRLYIDSVLEDGNMAVTRITDTDDFQYTATGLTNGQEYEFTVTLVINGEESNGVSVSATPQAFKPGAYTFEDPNALDDWTTSTDLSWEYDAMIQSGVLFLDPEGDYPDRVYVSTDPNVDDVTGITCRIRTNTNFVIWLNMTDKAGFLQLGLVPGGTKGDHFGFGTFYYYFLGSGLTDSSWHVLDVNLDEVLQSIFPTIPNNEAESVESVFVGGRIYFDDLMFY